MSSKYTSEIRNMKSNSDNNQIMEGNETNEIIEELFDSLLQKYQIGLEESMKGSKFTFDKVNLLHSKCHKISLSRGASYIYSPK